MSKQKKSYLEKREGLEEGQGVGVAFDLSVRHHWMSIKQTPPQFLRIIFKVIMEVFSNGAPHQT